MPGIEPVPVAGPVAAWIVAALEGAALVNGLSAIGAGLYSIDIPKDSILQYEVSLKADKFLLIMHGTADDVAKAKATIERTSPVEVNVQADGKLQTAGSV